jgi:glucose-1-phosphate cytidylyltransferase
MVKFDKIDLPVGSDEMPNKNPIKVVILAGGMGTRLAEETEIKPKPMVEIGGQPILWHILKHYYHYDFREFYIALGYKGEVIKRYFMDYLALNGSMSIDLTKGKVERNQGSCEDWLVNLIETGQNTNTGGRVKRLEPFLKNETFMLTYGDGVGDIDLKALLDLHRSQGRLVTVTAVRPPARFGGLIFDGDLVARFTEKPQAGEGWINGGFMVCEPGIFDYMEDDLTNLEADTLEHLAEDGQLAAFRHDGFWQCMDTLRDKRYLEGLWQAGKAPWKVW